MFLLCKHHISRSNERDCEKLIKLNFPLIIVTNILEKKKIFSGEFIEQLVIPFSIFKLEKKIITLLSRYEFSKSSLIALNKYTIDKNQRMIKKGNLELQLTEKEIDFLILFSQNNQLFTKSYKKEQFQALSIIAISLIIFFMCSAI